MIRTAADPRKPISVSLTYPMPVIAKTHLGGTPQNFFSTDGSVKTPYVPCDNNSCGALPQEVYRWEPLLNEDDKTPLLRNVTHKLQDTPTSAVGAFVQWGGLGAGIAGTLGVLIGAMAGDALTGAAIGIALGAAIPGTVAAKKAMGDRVRLEWQVLPIVQEEYKGYRETAQPAVVQGKHGYWHSFTPVLEKKKLGEYKVPKIVHYRADNKT